VDFDIVLIYGLQLTVFTILRYLWHHFVSYFVCRNFLFLCIFLLYLVNWILMLD